MLILSIKTDNPKAEVGLFNDHTELAHTTWSAHRQLAETLHTTINDLLIANHKTWQDIEGVVCFTGPGSFTGLRIGISVANALAWSNKAVLAGGSGTDWTAQATNALLVGRSETILIPEYGAQPHITAQKK